MPSTERQILYDFSYRWDLCVELMEPESRMAVAGGWRWGEGNGKIKGTNFQLKMNKIWGSNVHPGDKSLHSGVTYLKFAERVGLKWFHCYCC